MPTDPPYFEYVDEYTEEGEERYERLERDVSERIGEEDGEIGTKGFASAVAAYVGVRAAQRGLRPTSTIPVDSSEFEWFDRHAYNSYAAGREYGRNLLRQQGVTPSPGSIHQSGRHKRALNTMHSRQRQYWGALVKDLSDEVNTTLASGIQSGASLQQARTATMDRVQKVGVDRAKRIASYEPAWAFNKSMVMEYKDANVNSVTVDVKWETAGDGNVCEECMANAGTYTLSRFDSMIEGGVYPAHPYERCIAVPQV